MQLVLLRIPPLSNTATTGPANLLSISLSLSSLCVAEEALPWWASTVWRSEANLADREKCVLNSLHDFKRKDLQKKNILFVGDQNDRIYLPLLCMKNWFLSYEPS